MSKKRSYLARFLHWCAGADPEILDNPDKYLGTPEDSGAVSHHPDKQATSDKRAGSASLGSSQYNMGAIVFLTFLTAWASFVWTVYVLTEDAIVSAASGLVVGLIKLFWDRAVASSKSTSMAWWRMPFALPLSVFFALPLCVFVFEGYLDSTATDQHRAQVQHERERLQAEAEDRISAYESLKQEVDSLRNRTRFFEGMAEAEEFGLPLGQVGITQEEMQRYGVDGVSGTAGCGSRCERYDSEAESAAQAYERQNDALEGRSSSEEIQANIEAEVAALEEASPDMISRLELLVAEAMDRPLVGVLALLIVLIYCVIDLLPALQRIIENDDPYYKAVESKHQRNLDAIEVGESRNEDHIHNSITERDESRIKHSGIRIMGRKLLELLGKTTSEVNSPEDLLKAIEEFKKLYRKMQEFSSAISGKVEDPGLSDRASIPPTRANGYERSDVDTHNAGASPSHQYGEQDATLHPIKNGWFSEKSFT